MDARLGRRPAVPAVTKDPVHTALLRFSTLAQAINHPPVLASLLVGVGYYLGVKIGFALTFHPHPIAVLWPPNAILLAALLVTPMRWWGWLLAAALSAHLVAQLQANVPAAMVMCWFVSNASEALIGAYCVRRFTQGAPGLGSVRNVAVFMLFAVFFAPFLTSFVDAGFVKLIGWGGSDYWQLWRTRFFSNVLTTLTIVPVIVSLAGARRVARRMSDPARVAEAAALLLSVGAVCGIVFYAAPAESGATPVLLYLPLPFLLWAALRFGLAGSSTAFMIVALTAIWGASHGEGPFAIGTPAQNAFSVQIFLTFTAVMLLTLAAAVQERKRTKSRLRDMEDLFATAFRSSPDAISISRKADGHLLEINDRWEKTFGYARNEAVGRTVQELGIYASEAERLRFQAAAVDHGSVREMAVGLRARDGRDIQALVAAETVEMGGEPCFIITVRDLTAQRAAELEAREQRQQLTHLTRVATLGEMSGALAHELNQPLTAILSNSQAALRFLARDPVDLDEIREILRDIVEADKRAGEVIRRLRTMLKKGEIQFTPLDLNELLGDVIDLAHGDLVTRNMRVTTRFNSRLPLVSGDRVELQQLFLNLVSNACEAMAGRDESQHELSVTTSYEWDGTVHVAVADRGSGIPPDRLQRLFEPFYTTREQGLGLGLAICRTITSAHGGRIWAENNVGGGATFHVAVPIGKESRA